MFERDNPNYIKWRQMRVKIWVYLRDLRLDRFETGWESRLKCCSRHLLLWQENIWNSTRIRKEKYDFPLTTTATLTSYEYIKRSQVKGLSQVLRNLSLMKLSEHKVTVVCGPFFSVALGLCFFLGFNKRHPFVQKIKDFQGFFFIIERNDLIQAATTTYDNNTQTSRIQMERLPQAES